MNKKIWVEVATNRGGDNVIAYKGLMALDEMDAVRNGEIGERFVRLESSYWDEYPDPNQESFGQPQKRLRLMGREDLSNFTGEVYLKGRTIVSICVLRGGIDHEA